MFFTFPEDARWNAEHQAVEFGVEIGEYRGVVRVPRRLGAPSGVLGKVGEIGWSTPCAQFFPVPPPCSSSAVPWLSQPIRRSWPRQRPKFVKQCVTRRRKLGDVSGDDHPRARGRIDLQGADSARGGPSLDLSALSNPEAKPQGPRRDMPQCGQSSAVRAYRAVIGGFDRPLPMLGTICRCPSRSKARSWPQSHERLANVGLGWPAGLDRAGEQRRMG